MNDTKTSKRIKHSVAVLVRKGDKILTVRRPDDDVELPGIWGLPAGAYRTGETLETIVERIGRDKLGIELRSLDVLVRGRQNRADYTLEMELVEAEMDGIPSHSEWRWALPGVLQGGQERGSLCCDLALSI